MSGLAHRNELLLKTNRDYIPNGYLIYYTRSRHTRCDASQNLETMAILFDWYENPQSPDEQQEEQALHPRIHLNGTVDTDDLRKDIQSYCTISETDVSAVLDALSHCMGKELAEGRQVHLNGIGYFYPVLTCTERITAATKNKNTKVKLKGIKFRSDRNLKEEIGVIKMKCLNSDSLSNKLSEKEIDSRLTQYFQSHPILRRMDFEHLCGLTNITARRRIAELIGKGKLKNIGSRLQPIYVPGEGFYVAHAKTE